MNKGDYVCTLDVVQTILRVFRVTGLSHRRNANLCTITQNLLMDKTQ